MLLESTLVLVESTSTMTLDPRSIVVFILVDAFAFSISIVFFISKPEVVDEFFLIHYF